MLFFESGEVAGTVGGGCIEAEVWAEAREAMRSGKSALHHFSLTAEEASEEGMVCGGTMDIFIDSLGKEKMSESFIENYKAKHQHPLNQLTHSIGIPLIVISLPLFSLQLALGARAVCSWLDSSVHRPRR